MAIGIFKSLEFGGINSADYGVYITGEAVYNAPERAVEQVDIPGRNGAFLMDLGRFENIEVTYPCGIPGDDQTDFAEKISEFRNAILSKRGYQRLTDEYNPSEYRMASYVSGMEVEAVEGQQGTVGEFELTFNCKPQRWLVNGETAITVQDGDTLTNPTLFDSEPLLEVVGGGAVRFNGYTITLNDRDTGNVEFTVMNGLVNYDDSSVTIPNNLLNEGDTITFDSLLHIFRYNSQGKSLRSVETTITSDGFGNATVRSSYPQSKLAFVVIDLGGYATTYETKSVTVNFSVTTTDWDYTTATATGSVTMNIDTTAGRITWTRILTVPTGFVVDSTETSLTEASAYSTVSVLGHVYIDCELGECYKIVDGTIVSLNTYIDLGSDIPKLAPGTNTFSIDNTITDLTVTPRWWKV